jgi:hypothetical protein
MKKIIMIANVCFLVLLFCSCCDVTSKYADFCVFEVYQNGVK